MLIHMRVLMISPSYLPIKGGTEAVIHDISFKLKTRKVETAILTFNMDRKWKPHWHSKIEKNDGITVHKIPAFNWFPFTHSDRITMGINLIPGLFRRTLMEYDLLHFHGGDLTLPFFSFGVKKPKIFHLHGLSAEFYRRYYISRLILKNIAHIYICLTSQMKSELITLGIPEDKIEILPNGVDTNIFYPLGEKEENLALFVGRVCREKGVKTLLEAVKYLKTSINLAIIGPMDYDLKHFTNMLRLIEKENKKGIHKIVYLGAKNRDEIIEWYRKASFLVLPSQREGFPLVLIEALACETPVIATSVGGVSEILSGNDCGVIIPPNDPRKLAQAMQFLINNREIRIKLGRRGRTIVKKYFSLDVVVEKLLEIYEKMISRFGD